MTGIVERLGLWIPQVTGRYLNEDWNPENQGFGAQCWDTAANWSRYLGLPVISTDGKGRWPGWAGNMVDAFPQSPEIAAAYQLLGPDEPGLPGDIAVWGDGYYYYPKTHVAVLVNDLGAQLLCVSQNSSAARADNPYPQWTTGPTILQHLPRRGLIGLIRPRTGGLTAQGTTTPTEQDWLDMADIEEVRKVVKAEIRGALQERFTDTEGTPTSVKDMLETFRSLVHDVPRALLDTQIPRAGGEFGGNTSLRGVLAYADQKHIEALRATVTAAHGDGVSADQIIRAVRDGLAAGIKVEATVKVGE
jgi:hypothetical protein